MLVEVLIALVITASLVAVVLPFAGRLVQHWWRGETEVEVADEWMQAVARLSDDLEQAIPLSPPDRSQSLLCFRADPTRVQFVRPSLGLRAAADLEVVTLTIRRAGTGDALVRSARPFKTDCLDPGPESAAASTILEGNFRLRFQSVAEDGQHVDNWSGHKGIPIRIELLASAAARTYVPAPIILPIAARTTLASLQPTSGAPP